MLLDIGTEEIAHVEMLSNMIAWLLEGAPVSEQEAIAANNPSVAAVLGGINPHHAIVSGLGAVPADSVGFPWTSRYIVASGNLLADFRANVNAESQGRLQVARLYNMTDDRGVHDMFSFLLARETMHQNQWLAAIEELEKDGLETMPCPSSFPIEREKRDVSYQFWDLSEGNDSKQGQWAHGNTPDGKGTFEYIAKPKPLGPVAETPPADPRTFGTLDEKALKQTAR